MPRRKRAEATPGSRKLLPTRKTRRTEDEQEGGQTENTREEVQVNSPEVQDNEQGAEVARVGTETGATETLGQAIEGEVGTTADPDAHMEGAEINVSDSPGVSRKSDLSVRSDNQSTASGVASTGASSAVSRESAVDKLKKKERELTSDQKTELEGTFISSKFHRLKFLTTAMMNSDVGNAILNEAYKKLRIYTAEKQKQKKEAIARHIRQKFNRCKDYFVDNIKKAVLEENSKLIWKV